MTTLKGMTWSHPRGYDPMVATAKAFHQRTGIEIVWDKRSLQDFETWAGHEAKVELKQPVEGQKRFRGRIEGVEDGEIRLETELAGHGVKVIGLSAAEVASARLVLTDELVREALSRAKKQSKGSPSDGSDASALGLEGEQE